LPENVVYSTAATTVHVPQNNTVKWTINIFQVRYHVNTNHCSYTKSKILCRKKKPIRFTMLRSSLWSVAHQSTVTWRTSHFHEEQTSTEDDQRSCWPPRMRADTSVVPASSLERTLHVTQTWETYLFPGFWYKLCVRETAKPILKLEAFNLFSSKEMSLSTFKSKCHDDYGTWQEQSNNESHSAYSSANIYMCNTWRDKGGQGFWYNTQE
jgi:hypothetical protein